VALTSRRLAQDALLRNSFYLTLNTATMAAVAFVFWLLNARLFAASQVGMATTLISGASIISLISLFGFNTTFVRFLPTSRRRDAEINTGLIMVFVTALAAASVYVLLIPTIAPKLVFVRGSFGFAAGFVVLTAFWAVNLVTDSVFVAFRKTQYNVVCDGVILGVVKLGLPALMIGLGAYGMFLASGVAAAAAVVASILFMMRTLGYKPRLRLSPSALRLAMGYSAANYVANLLSLSPLLIVPLVVLDIRGSRQAAFYFIAYQMASLLFAIGYAVSLSLFAEGSHADAHLPLLLKRSVKLIAAVCVPSSVLVAATGHWLLLLFGKEYSANGTTTLIILALSAPSVALCSTAFTVLRVTRQLGAVVLASGVYAVVIVGLAVVGAGHGLPWVAAAWLLGNTVAALLAAGFAILHYRAGRGLRGARRMAV
jgi:O-antigen/teichoic acid export membrane protein